jgi:nucleotide-binding universal stress UspA family protein
MSGEKFSIPNTLLVAIDGSLPSQISARAAVQIARNHNLNIHGLYVVGARTIFEGNRNYRTELNLDSNSVTSDDLINQFKSQGDEALDWLEVLCSTWGVPVTTDILFGGIPEMILEEARQTEFLALGRRGHIHHDNVYTLGDNFRNIVTHLHIPILIGGNVLTDFKRFYIILSDHNSSDNLLYWGTQLQNSFASDILISIFQEDKVQSDKLHITLEQLKSNAALTFSEVGNRIQSGSDIVVAAREHDADLILMDGYRRKGLGLWVEKHLLDDVLLNSEIMVLVV